MDTLLGHRERTFLQALQTLETEHGEGRWFFTHAVVRTLVGSSAGELPPSGPSPYRLSTSAERAWNPSRVLARLADRGLVERNRMLGIGSSLRLTDAGRRLAAALAMPAATATEESESVAA